MRLLDVVRLWVLAVLVAMPVTARGCEGLVDGPRGTVVSVADGGTVVLDTGMVVRLIGTQAPKLPQGREEFAPWPKAELSRAALDTLTLGKQVIVRYGGETMDRHGRTLGQMFVVGPPQTWVQEQMLAAGLARAYTFADNRACAGELIAAEARARANRLGIWGDPYYAVRRADRPDDLAQRSGRYELVEGRVLQAESVQGRVYLNFGRTWTQDFTAVIDRAAVALFSGSGIDPLQLGGALVRVRGWVDVHDGPRIGVTHPEQIEVLAYR